MSHIWMRQWGFYRNVIRMRWECCKNPILISVYLTDIPSHFQNINESCHTYQCNPWMSYVSITRRSYSDTHMNLSYHTHEWVMSLIWMSLWTSHVSIARRSHWRRTSGIKEPYKRDSILQKTTRKFLDSAGTTNQFCFSTNGLTSLFPKKIGDRNPSFFGFLFNGSWINLEFTWFHRDNPRSIQKSPEISGSLAGKDMQL